MTQNFQLNIGDELGFNLLGQNINSTEHLVFFPIVEVTEIDGETAYKYQFPDGTASKTAIPHSALVGHSVRMKIQDLSIFDNDEFFIEVSTFDIKSAFNRENVRNFVGNVTEIADGEFEIYSYTSGNSYVVKIEEISKHLFKTNCTCRDFVFRKRVCKHIPEVFFDNGSAIKKAA